jgi:dipeptidyl aminopeptidase/acylaminoacyl peptidase
LSFWTKAKLLVIGVKVPRPLGTEAPAALASNCRAITIQAPDAVELSAWYYNEGSTTPLVILFHGYTAEKTCMLQEAKLLLGMGMSVLLVDFRGSGGSSESYTTIGVCEAEDVAAVVDYANQALPHASTILLGQSMGAVAILRAVHTHAITPDAVILEAVFDTMLNTVRNRFALMKAPAFPAAELLIFWGGVQFGFNGFTHNPVDYATSLRCPVLFMHGTDDPRAKLSEGRRVFDAVPGEKIFKAFASVGHESYASTYPDEWGAAVQQLVEKVRPREATAQ